MNILDLEMQRNDAGAKTVRDYLKALLSKVWEEDEGFDGKRPFGNSGWQDDLVVPLVKSGIVKGRLDDEGCLADYDRQAADSAIRGAISAL